jgi:Ca-activated chloride channel family protein
VTGYKRNKKGEVVLSRMDEETVAKMAVTTGGAYFRATESEQEIDLIKDQLDALEKDPLSKKQISLENRYQWFLAAALVCWLLSESLQIVWSRRLLWFFLFMFLFPVQHIHAESFERKMNEGVRLYRQKKYPEALKSFQKAGEIKPTDPRASFNQGTAFYKLGDWNNAETQFKQSGMVQDPDFTAKSLYNLGTSQLRNGQYAEAVQCYQQSLKLNPNDPDTKYNLKLALQFLKNPPQKKQESKSEEGKKQKSQSQQQQNSEMEKKEREENAKRILKSAAEEQNNRPLFNPQQKGKRSANEEDW